MKVVRRVISTSAGKVTMYVLAENVDTVVAIIKLDNSCDIYLTDPDENSDTYGNKHYVKLVQTLKKKHGISKANYIGTTASLITK